MNELEVCQLYNRGYSVFDISEELDISVAHVNGILRGK